jgi:hypothetical protein
MTAKQIARQIDRTERAVQKWAKSLSEHHSLMAEKISASSPAHPADYNLDETLLIIEKGLGKNAAAIYRTNAMASQAPAPVTDRLERIEKNMELITTVMLGMLQIRQPTDSAGHVPVRQPSRPQLEAPQPSTYYTIAGYCRKLGITGLTATEAIQLGKEAARLSREEGVRIGSCPDTRWGTVNKYHFAILDEIFRG